MCPFLSASLSNPPVSLPQQVFPAPSPTSASSIAHAAWDDVPIAPAPPQQQQHADSADGATNSAHRVAASVQPASVFSPGTVAINIIPIASSLSHPQQQQQQHRQLLDDQQQLLQTHHSQHQNHNHHHHHHHLQPHHHPHIRDRSGSGSGSAAPGRPSPSLTGSSTYGIHPPSLSLPSSSSSSSSSSTSASSATSSSSLSSWSSSSSTPSSSASSALSVAAARDAAIAAETRRALRRQVQAGYPDWVRALVLPDQVRFSMCEWEGGGFADTFPHTRLLYDIFSFCVLTLCFKHSFFYNLQIHRVLASGECPFRFTRATRF